MKYFLFLVCCVVYTHANLQLRIETEGGPVVGRLRTSYSGKIYHSYEGIPYAKPPVGSLRFQPPQAVEKWVGEWNASAPGEGCLQLDMFTEELDEEGKERYAVVGDEDCLFVNVYTRDSGRKNKEVLFWIHGGAFTYGRGSMFRPDYIMDEEDIIYVSVHYRLGPLGFLTTGNGLVPGNNGLKDQTAALAWVQRNIAAFGGDPSKVTVAGLSAGGASTHYHYLSPLSKGLFSKGWSYSGTALCPWAFVEDGPHKTKKLASLVGCPNSNDGDMIDCLRKRPAHQIVAKTANFQVYLFNPFTIFGPVIEKGSDRPFIDRHPKEIIQQGLAQDLPWITGVVTEEGLYPAAEFVGSVSRLQVLNDNWQSIGPSFFYLDPKLSNTEKVEIANKIRRSYLGDKDISSETVDAVVQMLGDRLFVAPVVEAAILQNEKTTKPVRLYNFGYAGTRSWSNYGTHDTTSYGVCHGDDVILMIKYDNLDSLVTENDRRNAKVVHNSLMTYVKTGNVPEYLGWEPLPKKPGDDIKYLNVMSADDIQMQVDNDLGKRKFLSEVITSRTKREEL